MSTNTRADTEREARPRVAVDHALRKHEDELEPVLSLERSIEQLQSGVGNTALGGMLNPRHHAPPDLTQVLHAGSGTGASLAPALRQLVPHLPITSQRTDALRQPGSRSQEGGGSPGKAAIVQRRRTSTAPTESATGTVAPSRPSTTEPEQRALQVDASTPSTPAEARSLLSSGTQHAVSGSPPTSSTTAASNRPQDTGSTEHPRASSASGPPPAPAPATAGRGQEDHHRAPGDETAQPPGPTGNSGNRSQSTQPTGEETPPPAQAETPAPGEGGGMDTALVDEELAEHERWGGALSQVGGAQSTERAAFINQQIAQGMGTEFVSAAGMGAILTLGTRVAIHHGARRVPVPIIGSIIGGALGAMALGRQVLTAAGRQQLADKIGSMGEGASGYEKAANTIDGLATILDLASNVLDTVGLICGVIAAVAWLGVIPSFGTTSPVAATCTSIATACATASAVLSAVKMACQPLVLVLRSLHTFTSQADPREVQSHGRSLQQVGGALGGIVGGFAGAAAGKGGAKRLGLEANPANAARYGPPEQAPSRTSAEPDGPAVEVTPSSSRPPPGAGDAGAQPAIDVGEPSRPTLPGLGPGGPSPGTTGGVEVHPIIGVGGPATPGSRTEAGVFEVPTAGPTPRTGEPSVIIDPSIGGVEHIPAPPRPPGPGRPQPDIDWYDPVHNPQGTVRVEDLGRIKGNYAPPFDPANPIPLPVGSAGYNPAVERGYFDTVAPHQFDPHTGQPVPQGYGTRATPGGAFHDAAFPTPEAAHTHGAADVAGGEGTFRSTRAIPQEWPRADPSEAPFRSPIENVGVYPIMNPAVNPNTGMPYATPHIASVAAPQPEGAPITGPLPPGAVPHPATGVVYYPGGGTQIQLPGGFVHPGTPTVGPTYPIPPGGGSTPPGGGVEVRPIISVSDEGSRPTLPGIGSPAAQPGGASPVGGTAPPASGDAAGGRVVPYPLPESEPWRRLAEGARSAGEWGERTNEARLLGRGPTVATTGEAADAARLGSVVSGALTSSSSSASTNPYTADNNPYAGVGAAAGETTTAIRSEAEAMVERVNPDYERPPGSPEQLQTLQSRIQALRTTQAMAGRTASQAQQDQDVALGRQGQIGQIGTTTREAQQRTADHTTEVSATGAANQQQQQRQQEAGTSMGDATSRLASMGTLETLLSGWAGAATGIAGIFYAIGTVLDRANEAGNKCSESAREATTFMAQLASAKAIVRGESAQSPLQLGRLRQEQQAITDEQSRAQQTGADLDRAAQGTQAMQEQNDADLADAQRTSRESEQDRDDAASSAEQQQAQHDQLQAELQAWAQRHKQQRQAAIDATVAQLQSSEYRIVNVRGR